MLAALARWVARVCWAVLGAVSTKVLVVLGCESNFGGGSEGSGGDRLATTTTNSAHLMLPRTHSLTRPLPPALRPQERLGRLLDQPLCGLQLILVGDFLQVGAPVLLFLLCSLCVASAAPQWFGCAHPTPGCSCLQWTRGQRTASGPLNWRFKTSKRSSCGETCASVVIAG